MKLSCDPHNKTLTWFQKSLSISIGLSYKEALVLALAIEQAPFVPKPPTEEEMVQNRVSLRRIALQISARHAKSPFKKRAS